jgi:hypothetical protein
MPRNRSRDLFVEAKSYCREELDALTSEHRKAVSELHEIQRLIDENKKSAIKIIKENQKIKIELDLSSLATYNKELKSKLKEITSRLRKIKGMKAALLVQAKKLESEDRNRKSISNPVTPSTQCRLPDSKAEHKNTLQTPVAQLSHSAHPKQHSGKKNLQENSIRKAPDKATTSTAKSPHDFFWHCPVCNANFLSEISKDRHIQTHGAEVVARALTSPTKSLKKQTTSKKNRQQQTNAVIANTYSIQTPYFKGACRICGKNRPMSGDDICYHCQSE